jgi:hypothetical protein
MSEAHGWATRLAHDLVGKERFEEAVELALRDELGEDELRRLKESNQRKREQDEENARLWREFAEQSSDRGSVVGTTDLSAAEERAVDALVADFAPRVADEDTESAEAKRKRLQAELRRVARKLEDVEEGSDKHRRLKKRYHELQKQLRALPGGDADREKSYPLEDFSEQGYFGVGELLQAASEDTDDLPQQIREDLVLQDELRRQAHEQAFGELSQLSDDELWQRYQRTLGEEA